METVSNFTAKFRAALRRFVDNESSRIRLQYIAIYSILCVVSAVMSVVNLFTGKKALMISTLVFALLSGLNILLSFTSEKGTKVASLLFRIEILVLFSFFIYSGTPEGFSAIWAALLPACGLLMFQTKQGSILSAIMFCIIVFFFWTPLGLSLLRDPSVYTASFKLRFPFLYIAFYAVGLFLETIRAATFANYSFMCTHDPLTEGLNRRGFTESIVKSIAESNASEVGFMIFDLDHFKQVNDNYGHFTGDEVLKETLRRLTKLTNLPVCRWGGEEFAVFVPDGRLNQELVDQIAAGFRSEPFIVGELTLPVTISVGAVTAERTDSLTPDNLGLEADECLYEAKETGRAKGVFRRIGTKAEADKANN